MNQKKDAIGENKFDKTDRGEIALEYVDFLVAQDIEDGICGIEYIAINPMWRSAWKKFYRQLVARERTAELKSQMEVYKDANESVSSQVQSPQSSDEA